MRKDGFERFYMEKVALGEGCGCAEMAINMRDVDADMKTRVEAARRGPIMARLLHGLAASLKKLKRA